METKFIEAHKNINKATDILAIDRDNAYSKEDEERYDEIISVLFDVKFMLNKLENNIRDLVSNANWYLGGLEAIEQGRSVGQPIDALREQLVNSLERISNDE